MSSGCCSFAAINMVLLKYNKGDFLEKYLRSIIDIEKRDSNNDKIKFIEAMMERYERFEPYRGKFGRKNTPQQYNKKEADAHKMDFLMNIGLLTLFMRWCKNSRNLKLLNDNIEYSKIFGTYYTNKFKDIKALPKNGPQQIMPGTFKKDDGTVEKILVLKEGDMANTWEGLKKTFELAVNKGSDGKKTVFFEDAGIWCDEEGSFMTAAGPAYKKRYSAVIKECRDWARKKKDTRFLIAGVFYYTESRERFDGHSSKKEDRLFAMVEEAEVSFNRLKAWNHINHYVVVPRISKYSIHDTDFFASSGQKKSWEGRMIPIRILKAEIL